MKCLNSIRGYNVWLNNKTIERESYCYLFHNNWSINAISKIMFYMGKKALASMGEVSAFLIILID